MRRIVGCLGIAVFLSVNSASVVAHHGSASFDTSKQVTLKGTVTEWIWANPHCWLKFDGKNESGEVTHWIVEASAPPTISAQGWSHNSFKPGDQVTLTMIQVKNGQAIGRFEGDVILNSKPFPPHENGSSGNSKGEAKP